MNTNNPYARFSLTGKDAQGNKVKTQLMGTNEACGMAKRIGLTGTIWYNDKNQQTRSKSEYYFDGDK